MTDGPSPSRRAEARAGASKRRTKDLERREAVFELFVSGFSHHEIAKAMGTSANTVRRIVDSAVAERQLDAPERYVRIQVARLTKALRHADFRLERGDMRVFGPYVKLIAAMDRYHRLDAQAPALRLPAPKAALALPPPLLALPGPAPAIDPDSGPDDA